MEIHIHKHLFQMPEETFNITYRCRWHIPARISRRYHSFKVGAGFAACKASKVLHTQFIADNLNGHGQIQGTVIGGGRNVDMVVATLELVVGKAVVLPAENQRHPALPTVFSSSRRRLRWCHYRPGYFATTGTGTHYQHTIGQRFIQ